MPISRTDVHHVLSLARLRIPEHEVDRLTADLQAIVAHVDALQAVQVTATDLPGTAGLRMREDAQVDGLGASGLAGSAGLEGTLVRVPRIVE